MRNLKKILALVLAMVMTFSVMSVAGAFTDEDKFDGNYAEAAEVLNGLGVFQGYPDDSFKPEKNITRAEVAALIYRIATGDTAGANVHLYQYKGPFTDVTEKHWAAGYINYCANAEYIRGTTATTFAPEANVTGYQALAMILRVVGYDKNKEFTGADWEIQVARIANDLRITDTVKGVSLRDAAPRQIVAELLFQTLVNANMVTYTPALGYQTITVLGKGTQTLGQKVFSLEKGKRTNIDAWGRPGYFWYSFGDPIAVIEEAYRAQYKTAVTECQIAADTRVFGNVALYVNGVQTSDVTQATDTVDTMGAQGRLTEVYRDRIVMIDTFLAKVERVKDATYDAAGHRKTPSEITLTVYDADTATYMTGSTCVQTGGSTNYSYVPGDMILLNAYTVSGNRDDAGKVSKNPQTNMFVYAELLGKADAIQGTQTVVWFNIGKHTVNNETYADAVKFHLDEAGSKTNSYTWFFDQYGNLIGNVEVATQYTYAVMTSIWWTNDFTNGSGAAKATLKYMDGTDNTVTVAEIEGCTPGYSISTNDVMTFANGKVKVATDAATNAIRDNAEGHADVIHGHLFQVQTLSNGSVILTKVNNGINHTELSANVNILNRYGYITSTGYNLPIDTETKFLVSPGEGGYTTYTGLNELPTFKAGAKVDYVLGAGGVADYVYIIGETVDSGARNFVLVTGNAYSAILRTSGGVSYWELTLPVPAEDGSVVTLKVLDDDGSMATVPANVATLTNITNHGKLFYVPTTNGLVAAGTAEGNGAGDVIVIDNINNDLPGLSGTNAVLLTDAKMLTGVAGGVINASVSGVANCRFNITASTVIVGELSDDMSTATANKVVYVIYNTANNDVAKVYVLDVNAAINPPADPTYKAITKTTVTAPAAETMASGKMVSGANYTGAITESSDLNCHGTLVVTTTWQKMNADGNYVDYAGEAFTAGSYRAKITLSVDNAEGELYAITADTVTTLGGKTHKGPVFYADIIAVNP